MTETFPVISVQATKDGRLRVGIEVQTQDQERLSFSVLIDTPARTHQAPGRTVTQIALAACTHARHFLDDLEQSFAPVDELPPRA